MPGFETDPTGAGVESWVPGELVTPLRDFELVLGLLGELFGLRFVPENGQRGTDPKIGTFERSKALGLARIRLTDLVRVVEQIRGDAAAAGGRTAISLTDEHAMVNVVIARVKDECARRLSGWTPVLEKNLLVDSVHASPYVSIGATGRHPVPSAEAVQIPQPVLNTDRDEDSWVDVGIVDTGLSPLDVFDGRWVQGGRDPLLLASTAAPVHVAGHATFIAGTVLRYAPNALLHVADVLDADTGSAGVWEVAKGMMALATSVRVLNLSFCCFTADGTPPLALSHAIGRIDPTTVIVAAAGNHGALDPASNAGRVGPTSVMWPAGFDRVLAVGAHDDNGVLAPFSPDVPWVQLTATGRDLVSTYLRGEVRMHYSDEDRAKYEAAGEPMPETRHFDERGAVWSGTSFAAAVVTGIIAADTDPGRWGAHDALGRLLATPVSHAGTVRIPDLRRQFEAKAIAAP